MHPSQTSMKGSDRATAPSTAHMEARTMTRDSTTRTWRSSAEWLLPVKSTAAASTASRRVSTEPTLQVRALRTPGRWKWGKWRTAELTAGDLDKDASPFSSPVSSGQKRGLLSKWPNRDISISSFECCCGVMLGGYTAENNRELDLILHCRQLDRSGS